MLSFPESAFLLVSAKNIDSGHSQSRKSTNRKILDSNDQNQVADVAERFSLKQWFAGGAQSRGLRKPSCGHCYLRFFPRKHGLLALLRILRNWKNNGRHR